MSNKQLIWKKRVSEYLAIVAVNAICCWSVFQVWFLLQLIFYIAAALLIILVSGFAEWRLFQSSSKFTLSPFFSFNSMVNEFLFSKIRKPSELLIRVCKSGKWHYHQNVVFLIREIYLFFCQNYLQLPYWYFSVARTASNGTRIASQIAYKFFLVSVLQF